MGLSKMSVEAEETKPMEMAIKRMYSAVIGKKNGNNWIVEQDNVRLR